MDTFGEFEIVREEAVVANFKPLSRHSPDKAEEIQENCVRIVGDPAEIRTENLWDVSQNFNPTCLIKNRAQQGINSGTIGTLCATFCAKEETRATIQLRIFCLPLSYLIYKFK